MSETAVALPAFLDDSDRPPGTLTYPELQGFLFAVANAPEVIAPSEWIAEVFGGEAAFDNEAEERSVYTALVQEYLAVNDASLEGVMPPGCLLRDEPMANFDDDAPVRAWSRGFCRGYGWLEETWSSYLPQDGPDDDPDDAELAKEFGATLTVLAFFSSLEVAGNVAREMREGDVRKLAGELHEMFPDAVAQYVDIGLSIRDASEEVAPEPYRRESPKIGRNEPCPCGSGRKYKRCCGGEHGSEN